MGEKMLKEIEERRSIRKYNNESVSDDLIEQVLEGCRLAPSGSNTQPWRFIVVKSVEMRKKLVEADHNQQWMMDAPVFIVCIADSECREECDSGFVFDDESTGLAVKRLIRDTSIGIGYMLLQARHLGLDTCWTGWFEESRIKEILNIPNDKYVLGIVTLGYRDENPAPRKRKPLKEMIKYEKW